MPQATLHAHRLQHSLGHVLLLDKDYMWGAWLWHVGSAVWVMDFDPARPGLGQTDQAQLL
jgi:hypothetical protein